MNENPSGMDEIKSDLRAFGKKLESLAQESSQPLADRAGAVLSDVRSDLQKRINDTKNPLHAAFLALTIGVLHELEPAAKNGLDALSKRLHDHPEAPVENAAESEDDSGGPIEKVKSYVAKNPWQALGIAVLAGYVAHRIFSKKKED